MQTHVRLRLAHPDQRGPRRHDGGLAWRWRGEDEVTLKNCLLARASLLTLLGSVQFIIAAPALAQDQEGPPAPVPPAAADQLGADEETIIVTGSRIRRDPLEQSSPVTVVDQSAIDRTGLSSVADVLQRLPIAGGALNSKFNNSGNFGNPPDGGGVGAGAAEVDLRYLGSRRTLVLVDGLRFVNGSSASGVPASVDLNAIPESMIERVEVLLDGASPIYGSDAIAGVVNIIRSEEHTSELQSLMRISYAVFCLTKKNTNTT